MEGIVVAGVSCDRNEARIALRHVPDVPGIAAKIFTPLSKANIVVDMIIQNTSLDGSTDLTFTVPRTDLKQAMRLMNSLGAEVGITAVEPDAGIAKVSIVGVGMRSHAGVATMMFKVLADEGINIKMISTSEIKISAVIDEKYAELAVRALHRAFELGKNPNTRAAPSEERRDEEEEAEEDAPKTDNGQHADLAASLPARRRGRGRGRGQASNGKNGASGVVHMSRLEPEPPMVAPEPSVRGKKRGRRVSAAPVALKVEPKTPKKKAAAKRPRKKKTKGRRG